MGGTDGVRRKADDLAPLIDRLVADSREGFEAANDAGDDRFDAFDIGHTGPPFAGESGRRGSGKWY